MGVSGEQEAAVGNRGKRGTAGGQQKVLVGGGGPKKITGAKKQQQLLEIPEEGRLSNSLTDEYETPVPYLKVEWPVEGDEEEEGEEGRGRRMPRFEIFSVLAWFQKRKTAEEDTSLLYSVR